MKRISIDRLDIVPMLEFSDDAGNKIHLKMDVSDNYVTPLLVLDAGDKEFYFTTNEEVLGFCNALTQFATYHFDV